MVDQVSQIMYVFALIAFGVFYYYHPRTGIVYLFVDAAILLAWAFVLNKRRRKGEAFFRLGLLIAAVGWIIGPARNIWMAILYALAGILEKQVKFPKEIGFSKDEISFNSLPRKVVRWNEVSNVLIKDGIITIDQKNNHIYQKEIEGYVTAEIEKEFNNFASQCIVAANPAQ